MKYFFLSLFLGLACVAVSFAQSNPKREFRGAWMHTVFQAQYAKQSTDENKAYLRDQLDKLKAAGVNAVLFQVRPSADAFYDSKYEPWSRFLTKGGAAPSPYWDPLQFMIEETHARGMELHAWLNPYRVTTSKSEVLPKSHIYHKEPWRFVKYEGDGKLYFDPGLPENREFIVKVVLDIVNRYDVDGIHFDDYFYPYPAGGKDFPDAKSFAKYGKGMKRDDWRRQNVDKLIEDVYSAIKSSRQPWVRFGISPFGIWRNKKNDSRGSDTNGLGNYDDLYADVLLWAQKGWVDYLIPQLYWELEHAKASYLVLVDWWANSVDPKCQLYIGQDVERTMKLPDIAPSKSLNQLDHKVRLTRDAESIQGNCWWPGYSITADSQGSASALKSGLQSTFALVPSYSSISSDVPYPVRDMRLKSGTLSWEAAAPAGKVSDPVRFVVYRFDTPEDIDFENPANILDITPARSVKITRPGIYSVTALDRANNESDPSEKIQIK
ncbi:MAG: family 10 glycosylhydrolase [Clostridium sp.]|nr:family 10 glycosylhydrolase [Clostridium sp.]